MSFLCRGFLECVSKIPEYAISGVAAPFLRHKARLSAAKPSDLFLELTETHSKPFDGLFELTNNVNGRTTYLHLRMVQFKTQY